MEPSSLLANLHIQLHEPAVIEGDLDDHQDRIKRTQIQKTKQIFQKGNSLFGAQKMVPPSPIIEDDQEDNSYHIKNVKEEMLTPPDLKASNSSALYSGSSIQKVVTLRPDSAVMPQTNKEIRQIQPVIITNRRPGSTVRKTQIAQTYHQSVRPTSAQVVVLQTNNFMTTNQPPPQPSSLLTSQAVPYLPGQFLTSVPSRTAKSTFRKRNATQNSTTEQLVQANKERMLIGRENAALRLQIKGLEKELVRKDGVIRQLISERGAFDSNIDQLSQQDQCVSLKSQLTQARHDLLGAQETLHNLKTSLRYTRMQDLEGLLAQANSELDRLRAEALGAEGRRIRNKEYQRMLKLVEGQAAQLGKVQEEVKAREEEVKEKDHMIYRQREAIQKLGGKVAWYKERASNAHKKVKVLQARLGESRPSGSQRRQESIEPVKSQRSPRNHQIVNGVLVLPTKRDKSKNTADYFEKYVVERTKNERILANLVRLGIQVDLKDLYMQVPEKSSERLSGGQSVNIKVFDNNPAQSNESPTPLLKNQMKYLLPKAELDLLVKEIRVKLQIKRIPQIELSQYFMQAGESLQNILTQRFQMHSTNAQKMVQHLTQGKKEGNQQYVLINRLCGLIGGYQGYNGQEIGQGIQDIVEMLKDAKAVLLSQLEELADAHDLVPLVQFYEILEDDCGIELSDYQRDFFDYLIFRQSDSLTHINYKKFFEIFEEGYLLEESPYERDGDSRQSLRQQSSLDSHGRTISGIDDKDHMQVTENELMVFMDGILGLICRCFTQQFLTEDDEREVMQGFSQSIGPYLRQRMVTMNGKQKQPLIFVTPQDLFKYFAETLQIQISETEMNYVAHVLGREDLGEGAPIVYSEFIQILTNFLRKERMYAASISQGIPYDKLRTRESFDYLLAMRQLLKPESSTFRVLLSKNLITHQAVRNQQKQVTVEVIKSEALFTELQQNYGMKALTGEARNEIQQLFCIDHKYPELVLLNKVDRILLHDFDHVYINLLHQVRGVSLNNMNPHSTFMNHQESGVGVPSDIEEVDEIEDGDSEPQQRRRMSEVESDEVDGESPQPHRSLHHVEEQESIIDEPVLSSNPVTQGDKDFDEEGVIEDEYI